jgi:hypothetical protein
MYTFYNIGLHINLRSVLSVKRCYVRNICGPCRSWDPKFTTVGSGSGSGLDHNMDLLRPPRKTYKLQEKPLALRENNQILRVFISFFECHIGISRSGIATLVLQNKRTNLVTLTHKASKIPVHTVPYVSFLEAEFLDVIRTKVLKVFLLAIHRHHY